MKVFREYPLGKNKEDADKIVHEEIVWSGYSWLTFIDTYSVLSIIINKDDIILNWNICRTHMDIYGHVVRLDVRVCVWVCMCVCVGDNRDQLFCHENKLRVQMFLVDCLQYTIINFMQLQLII